ncbi:halocarboxylic acid dehydrogenase DehI family protein [Geminicoccaceae bacterium 1502E]|nr:halocarboxylic acid dehydrogenase DehI family protein [Geminicoccaceae bacterium 1502E]
MGLTALEQARLRRGMELVPGLPEVSEKEAGEAVRRIFEDVKASLRVPFVNFVFRTLANEPAELARVWNAAGPLARTRAFEQAADVLRAGTLMEPLPRPLASSDLPEADLPRIRAFVDSIHYALPKLLLVTSLLEAAPPATSTQIPEPLPYGVAEGTAMVAMVDQETASPALQALFAAIKERHGHPGVATFYRSLANWPAVLDALWERLAPQLDAPAHGERRSALIAEGMRLAASLPGERPGPLPERLRDVLSVFRLRFIPDLMIDVATVKALLDGPEAVRRSRFSAA